jgi:hypothetical protein
MVGRIFNRLTFKDFSGIVLTMSEPAAPADQDKVAALKESGDNIIKSVNDWVKSLETLTANPNQDNVSKCKQASSQVANSIGQWREVKLNLNER